MAFWSSDKIKIHHTLIKPFDGKSVKQGSYELKLGPQGAITCALPNNSAINLAERQAFSIPPGQFGLMLTEEYVTIPDNVLGFISLKTGIKSFGLVNVSGFHVDPGFSGRLKFWVYNAGNQDIIILRGDPVFLIWFSDLDQSTFDPYPRNGPWHNEITASDLSRLQGNLASPSALAKQIAEFQHKLDRQEYMVTTLIVIVTGLSLALAAPLFEHLFKFLTD